MIDLHIHTIYSDGTESCETVLKKCQDLNLDYISITDHNTALAYEELEKKNIEQFYSGHIIPGIELNTKILDIPIEILGYGIDYKKMNQLVKEVYIPSSERNLIEVQRLYTKCKTYGIVLEENCLDSYSPDVFASVFFHKQITKNLKNKALISDDAWNSSKIFYRQYMSDPKTPLYVEMNDFVPDFKKVSSLIKETGGLVFLPHIYEYKNNYKIILQYILDNYKIDGIECYYSTFTEEQHKEILDICRSYNLFISGGSDFHGKIKPDVSIAKGFGNLNIPTFILNDWIDMVAIL